MPDPVTPSLEAPAGDPNAQAAPGEGASTPPTAPEPAPVPKSLKEVDLRFTASDGVPTWAVGKTSEEMVTLAADLYDALQRGETMQASPTPPTPPPSGTLPTVDANLIYSNPAEYHRQMEARMEAIASARVSAATPGVFQPMASIAKEQARAHRPNVWERYGPEIETTMASVNPTLRSDVGTWKRAVDIVAGAHVDELAETKAREIVARGGGDSGTLSGSGGPPGGETSKGKNPIDALFKEDSPAIRGFKADGISAEKVMEHGRKRGYTPEAYAKILTDRAARREGAGLR